MKEVTCKETYEWKEDLGLRRINEEKPTDKLIVVIDCGVKFSILRNLKEHFEKVIIVTANTQLNDIPGR